MQEDPKDILELSYLQYKKVLESIDYSKKIFLSETIEKQSIKIFLISYAGMQILSKLIKIQPVKIEVKKIKLIPDKNIIYLFYNESTKKFYKIVNNAKFNYFFSEGVFYTNEYTNQIYIDVKKIPDEIKIMLFLEDLFNALNNDKLENLYNSFKKILDNPIEEKSIDLKMEFRNYMEWLYFNLKASIYAIHSIENFDLYYDMSYYFNAGFSFSKESIEAFIEWLSSANKYVSNVSASNYPNIKFDNHIGRDFAYNISNFIKLLNALSLTKNSFDNLQDKYDYNEISTEEFVNAYKNYLDATDLLNLFREVIDYLVYNYHIEFNTPNGIIVLENKPKIQE